MIKVVMPSDAFKIQLIRSINSLYWLCQYENKLCLMTIATWYHSFPSRTGQWNASAPMIVRIARVKVGHRQAFTASKGPARKSWAFCFCGLKSPLTKGCNHPWRKIDGFYKDHRLIKTASSMRAAPDSTNCWMIDRTQVVIGAWVSACNNWR